MEHPMLLDSRQSFEYRTSSNHEALRQGFNGCFHMFPYVSLWIYMNLSQYIISIIILRYPQHRSVLEAVNTSTFEFLGALCRDRSWRSRCQMDVTCPCSFQTTNLPEMLSSKGNCSSEDSGHFSLYGHIMSYWQTRTNCMQLYMPYDHLWSYYGRIESDFVKNFCLARGSLSLGRCSFLEMYIMGISHHRFTA